MAEIVVVAAHPQIELSRVTRALMRAASRADSQRIDVRDLYALYPDYYIDVATEQAVLRDARLVVWLHPIHWYSMTPLMKLWLDRVFEFGWAYGPGGQALVGKDLWLAVSTGGPEASYHPTSYNRSFFDAYLQPYEQTAALVGMRWLPPLVLHGAHQISDDAIARHARVFADRLRDWPQWPEIDAMEPSQDCSVPADARPQD